MPEYLAPGVYVEEVSFRPKSIEGVGTSTTAFVGPTRKGPLTGTPEVITSFGEFARIYGGLADLTFDSAVTNYMAHAVRNFFDNGGARLYISRTFIPHTNSEGAIVAPGGVASSNPFVSNGNGTARFVARAPGSVYNGEVRVIEKRTPATEATLRGMPQGSLVRTGGDQTAQPAALEGGNPPFAIPDGAQLALTVNGTDFSVTFNGSAAEVRGNALAADPVTIPDDTVLNVTIGTTTQSLEIPADDYSLVDLVSFLNANLRHGYVSLKTGNKLAIGTDQCGTGAHILVGAIEILGFTTDKQDDGDGNVQNLEAVTRDEIAALLEAAAVPVNITVPPLTGKLTIATVSTGKTATLQASDPAAPAVSARTMLSLSDDPAAGVDGIEPLFYQKVDNNWIGGANRLTTLDLSTLETVPAEIVTMNLEAKDGDGNVIAYEDLGFARTHPRFIGLVLPQEPTRRSDALQNPYYLEIGENVHPFDLHDKLFGAGTSNAIKISGGDDGVEPEASTTVPAAVSYENALALLESVDDISIIAAPGSSSYADYRAIQMGLISHAERMKYRIAVLDAPPANSISEVRSERSYFDSKYAAYYYPWAVIDNPQARPGNDSIPKEIAIPPSGFVTGIYARSDIERGVWKAPANEVVRGALRFEREINHSQQEVINPEGINCLRYFFGRGNRVWGARTLSSDPEWKYVNVRRYLIYLEKSIDRSTQWAVFEPNGERLWANIRDTVSAFLYNEWRNGALLGSKVEEAYFVRCDRSTMTQNDLDNGRLICEVGVAVLKPAEFVIFRIGQKTADARS